MKEDEMIRRLDEARVNQNQSLQSMVLDQPVTRRELLDALVTLGGHVPGTHVIIRRLRAAWGLAVLLLLLAAPAAHAQNLRTTLVKLAAPVEWTLANGFTEAHEATWCVTGYTSAERTTYTLVTVTQVRPDSNSIEGTKSMTTSAATCRGAKGEALPTIHVHPDHVCQASPEDLQVWAARMAPFDGIVCGEKAFVWYFSQDIVDVWSAQVARGRQDGKR